MSHPKAPMTNYHHKLVKLTDNISVYHKGYHIGLQASMKNLKRLLSTPKFTNFVTVSHKNY